MKKRFKDYINKKAILKSGLFDEKYYLLTYPEVEKSNLDPLTHYLQIGAKEGKNPSKEFDTKYYLKNNPDVKEIGINPLVHFLRYGAKEGRNPNNLFSTEELVAKGILQLSRDSLLFLYLKRIIKKIKKLPVNIENHIVEGMKKYDKYKDTILLISHESSSTGAPLLGLNIGKGLCSKYNLIHLVIRKSNIHNEFLNDSFITIENINIGDTLLIKKILENMNEKYQIKCVIGNSIVTYPILQLSKDLNIATLSLVHEFSEYTKPSSRIINNIIVADRVIYPAKIVIDSTQSTIEELTSIRDIPKNIIQYPQGKIPYIPSTYGHSYSVEYIKEKLGIVGQENFKVLVASGLVQMRKGVDLFIYVAAYIKKMSNKRYKFIWVGDGFEPDNDLNYSLWLKREIKHLGLEKDFIFLEHQKDLGVIFGLADIFCLTSRMDPFPNVVIDAMEANLPIACFDNTSGIAEFLKENNAESIVADYLDTYQLAQKIIEFLEEDKPKSNKNSLLVEEKLNFNNYIDFLEEQIDLSYQDNLDNQRIFEIIKNSEMFDNKFATIPKDYENSIKYYVSTTKNKLIRMCPNPRPGFSNLKWIVKNRESKIPFYEALVDGIISTHECKIIPFDIENDVSYMYAVHLHLFYIDLAEEFVHYFKNLPHGYDLYITVVDESIIQNVFKIFENCGANKIEMVVVDNVGRDVAPMLFDLKEKLYDSKYKIIGHFHSKKSISTDNQLGNKWRKYLLDNLIGDKEDSKSILSLFNDNAVGLVFAEDRHYMDMGENKEYFDSLCNKMGIKTIDETPVFPLGNMFWARTESIKQLFTLNKTDVIQPEPLPYDGSYMHALERITPQLVNENQFKYITVYKNGTSW